MLGNTILERIEFEQWTSQMY